MQHVVVVFVYRSGQKIFPTLLSKTVELQESSQVTEASVSL